MRVGAAALIAWTIGTVGAHAQSPYGTPPASCRNLFVGTWTYFGGSTVINPDGTANPSIGVPVQYWTCSGRVYTFSNPGGQTYSSTLSEDGTKLVGAGTATRVGPAPAASTSAQPRAPEAAARQEKAKASGGPVLVQGTRLKGLEGCTSYTISDADYARKARFFKQDPPHEWDVLVTASSTCKEPVQVNACFKFHGLDLPYQQGGGPHLIRTNDAIDVAYASAGIAKNGRYSYNIRFCKLSDGPCPVPCP